MPKKCSIITVNLNDKAGLEKTIQSVVGQTFRDIEYIVIDGASSDGSVEVIQQYADHIDKWITEPDTGVYNAMNKGIVMATSEYLLFLNSGDTLLSSVVIEKAAPYLFSGTDIVYGNLRFDHDTYHEDYQYPDKLTFGFLYERSLGHPATFIRKVLLEALGGYDESYPISADWFFFTKAVCFHNCTYQHLPFVIANFTTDGMSSVERNIQKVKEERRRALTGPFRFLTEYHEKYTHLKDRMDSLRRSKPYRFLKFLGLPKYR